MKHVPKEVAVAYFEGSWRSRVRWRRADASPDDEQATLLDLTPLLVVPKRVRPIEKQHAYESRKLWENVTNNLLAKEYGEATKHKHAIEQRQRDKAAEKKKKGEECVYFSFGFHVCTQTESYYLPPRHIPTYFEKDIESGIPKLTAEGEAALEEELKSTDGAS